MLPTCCLLVLAFVPQSAGKAITGKRVQLDAIPTTQLADNGPWHEVLDELRIATATFPVSQKGKRLFVARSAEGSANFEARASKPVAFKFKTGMRTNSVKLRFAYDETWRFASAEATRFKIGRRELLLYDANCDTSDAALQQAK